jgi:hypothetical protein
VVLPSGCTEHGAREIVSAAQGAEARTPDPSTVSPNTASCKTRGRCSAR